MRNRKRRKERNKKELPEQNKTKIRATIFQIFKD